MTKLEQWRTKGRLALAIFYAIAGTLHILLPGPFLSITPAWVPNAPFVILFTGICEIAGAAALLMPSLRRVAGTMLAVYAVCVYPANIKHAIDGLSTDSWSLWLCLYHMLRLPIQPLIVWLALFAGNVMDWPFQRRAFR